MAQTTSNSLLREPVFRLHEAAMADSDEVLRITKESFPWTDDSRLFVG